MIRSIPSRNPLRRLSTRKSLFWKRKRPWRRRPGKKARKDRIPFLHLKNLRTKILGRYSRLFCLSSRLTASESTLIQELIKAMLRSSTTRSVAIFPKIRSDGLSFSTTTTLLKPVSGCSTKAKKKKTKISEFLTQSAWSFWPKIKSLAISKKRQSRHTMSLSARKDRFWWSRTLSNRFGQWTENTLPATLKMVSKCSAKIWKLFTNTRILNWALPWFKFWMPSFQEILSVTLSMTRITMSSIHSDGPSKVTSSPLQSFFPRTRKTQPSFKKRRLSSR